MNYSDAERCIKENKPLVLKYLPKYAEFLQSHYLDELTNEIIRLSHSEEVSYFQNYKNLSEDEYFDLNYSSLQKLLDHLSHKSIDQFITESTNEYMNNRMPVVEKEDILAKDIIIHAMIIRKGFRHFLKDYTSDTNYFILVMDDVDSFMAAYKVSLFSAYLHVQQEKLKMANAELILAQNLSKMGSFTWNLLTGEVELTEAANNLLMLDNKISSDDFYRHVHPDDISKIKDRLKDAFYNNGRFECEYNYIRDGISKHIHSIGVVTFDNGKPLKLQGSIIDKTTEYNLRMRLMSSN